MIRPWMLDESAHAGPEHLDPAFVAGYDRKQGRPDPREDLEILAAHGVATVVDLAAGTGQFALAAALRFDRVTAVDISPAMLDHVRARAAEQGLANLEVVGGGLLTWEYAGPPVDAVFTRHALHQVPDFFKAIALARIAKMLRPGGILRLRDLIYDFGPDEAEEIFEGWMRDASADPALGYTADDYAEHVRTEHSTFRWLLEPMLEAAGFEILDAAYDRRLYGAYTCRRRS
ncbi:class I SAM-dependent methyltransferase [Nonomuraea dietziae]|uniref:class I SAM-dependent methyltransferase n=1 Tax=Nonomuraea dietziae TaxID=65515 RepID=UPI0033F6CC35